MDNITKVKVNDTTYGIVAGGSATVSLLKDNWADNTESGGVGTYTQTVSIDGINATISCVVDINIDNTTDIDSKYNLWSNIYNVKSVNISGQQSGGLKFYSKIKLNSDILVNVKW